MLGVFLGTLPQCLAGSFSKMWRNTNVLKVIIFVMTNMGMLAAAQISLIWTGFLHLGIHVKKICVIGSFYTSN
jgi:hypothetical protein